MLMAPRESKRGRKDWESRGFAAKAEIRPWREQRGERSGFGRKSAGSARAGGARRGHLEPACGGRGKGCRPCPQLMRRFPHLVAAPCAGMGRGRGPGTRGPFAALRPRRRRSAGHRCPAPPRPHGWRCLGGLSERGPVRGHTARCRGSALGHQNLGFVSS